jgi:D-hexose-6-phosphate mutarotase
MPVKIIEKNESSPSEKIIMTFINPIKDNNIIETTCELFTFGSHIVSWRSKFNDGKEDEHLWMSSLSNLNGESPIRGGIPIAFPQFANIGAMPLHGFAREYPWKLINNETTDISEIITLNLESNNDISLNWNFPYQFKLILIIELSLTSLSMNLEVENNSNLESFLFSGCFHTYFNTSDISNLDIYGLENCNYIDKVDDYKHKIESISIMNIKEQSEIFGLNLCQGEYFIDRVYYDIDCDNELNCSVLLSEIIINNNNSNKKIIINKSNSWSNWVVFNPWKYGKKGDKGVDFDDDGYLNMLCIEPAVAITTISLNPNSKWIGYQKLSISY